jgi:hypothetical protein
MLIWVLFRDGSNPFEEILDLSDQLPSVMNPISGEMSGYYTEQSYEGETAQGTNLYHANLVKTWVNNTIQSLKETGQLARMARKDMEKFVPGQPRLRDFLSGYFEALLNPDPEERQERALELGQTFRKNFGDIIGMKIVR